jgi:hypothetical protein
MCGGTLEADPSEVEAAVPPFCGVLCAIEDAANVAVDVAGPVTRSELPVDQVSNPAF